MKKFVITTYGRAAFTIIIEAEDEEEAWRKAPQEYKGAWTVVDYDRDEVIIEETKD